ncbi:hypothetical protein DFA_11182 [Cavenderia fasciculata]|uniref:BPL/LPL catalytic domain-containing protein n=1 Tax=Cavenderia fasciculata TaxID=261658 RepID=F4QFB4_CACFS|nr:uncharacterized protein DFA_11182 [Cavenderia fasciculata]EGG13421.1 hypothetical protein DFA_11182 [Cavenderia fasciculata]|eukprot:XP_004350125.1 hypothetical protein DFA_11182 [Cavenderia fasciculata]
MVFSVCLSVIAGTLCKKVFVRNLGRMSYNRCLDVQQSLQNVHSLFPSSTSVINNLNDEKKNTLLLVEHSSPVFTYAENNSKMFDPKVKSKLEHLGIEFKSVSKRTDGIVWHGPGQLSIYPMVFDNNADNHNTQNKNVSSEEMVSSIFRVIQRTLSWIGIESQLQNDGIYVGKDFKEKIGDFNVLSNSMNIPGFSLNINPNLTYYKYLESAVEEPSTLSPKSTHNGRGCNITSVWNQTLNHNLSIGEIVPIMLENFSKEFGTDFIDSNRLYQLRFNNNNNTHESGSTHPLFSSQSNHIIGNPTVNSATTELPKQLSFSR